MIIKLSAALAAFALGCAPVAAQTPSPSPPIVPSVSIASDGTLTIGPRTVPPAAYISPEARAAYTRLMAARISPSSAPAAAASGDPAAARLDSLAVGIRADRDKALKLHPEVSAEESKIGGIAVTIYTPKDMPKANAHKVGLEFEIDSEAVMVSAYARIKTISVHYRLRPAGAANDDILAVYKEILKTYKPQSIAFFGTSGGCTLAMTTALWLPDLKLPLPGAMGLMTCSGGANPTDARVLNNGLDPLLSSFARAGLAPKTGAPTAYPPHPGRPPADALDGSIPKGFPPSFMLTGTRDMCLGQTVVLHRRLINAGANAELNVFEGMWHAFHGDAELPESQEAMKAFSAFLGNNLK